MCAVPTPLPEVTGCNVSKTVWRKTSECKHNKLQGGSSVVTGMKVEGDDIFWGRQEKKKKKMCMVHPAQTTLITLWGAGCSQGQMDNTCFARADSEIVSIFECTDTAIKWTGVLGQLLRFRKRGGLDSASSLPSVQQGCTDNVLPWELARAERLLGTSFPPPVLCFAAAEPCCWPACSLP